MLNWKKLRINPYHKYCLILFILLVINRHVSPYTRIIHNVLLCVFPCRESLVSGDSVWPLPQVFVITTRWPWHEESADIWLSKNWEFALMFVTIYISFLNISIKSLFWWWKHWWTEGVIPLVFELGCVLRKSFCLKSLRSLRSLHSC